ncbi:MAG: sigma-70 family RNA polymerase sigma factor [Gemmatimonadetes bacterium]|nr:sigma-70 family RNA polymerase sigma factor [Gemmatimonadota bacterium]
MTERSDGALVARVLAGEPQAFGILVERHQDRMLAYVRYMGFDESESRDLAQEAFVRAFRHLRRCGDPERFAGWLFKIVSNVCRTAGARATRRSTESLEAVAPSLVSDGPMPDEQAETRWLEERMRRALDALQPDQREALVLMYLQGYSVQEIEELTGASASAVNMRLKRGREALKELLGPVLSEVSEP